MNRIKIALFALLLSIVVFVFNPGLTLAQQGCCSWHGGISYCDSSVGTYVCNDGTYSPSCGCYKAPQVIQPPDFPQNVQAKLSYTPNTARGYTVIAELTDSNPTRYSAVLSKVAGADPGPLVDFNGGVFTYFNIAPGNYYLNVRQDINGKLSKVVYWKVEVPVWNPPIPTTTPAVDTPTNKKSIISSFFGWILSFVKSKNTTTLTPVSTLTPTSAPKRTSADIDPQKYPELYKTMRTSELIDQRVDVDCSDFTEQFDSQYFLETSIQEVGYDYAHLDGDSDGDACESLP